MADLLARVGRTIHQSRLIEPGDRIVVGVSGGPDSMALLDMLVALNRGDGPRWAIQAAHLNHQIRGAEADRDAELVRSYCQRAGIALVRETVNIPSLAAGAKGSLEEIGRKERYAFFERIALGCGANRVVVAHHADDNAETILHRLMRGTGLRGLRGMRASRPIRVGSDILLVRPLLDCRRHELRTYVRQRGIPFGVDRTNADLCSTRSRIRNELLPLMAGHYNPAVVEALLRLGRQAARADDYVSETAADHLGRLRIAGDESEVRLNVEGLSDEPTALQSEILRQAVTGLGAGQRDLGYDQVESLRQMLAPGAGGRAVDLPGGLGARREHGQLVIFRRDTGVADGPCEPEAVALPGRTCVAALGVAICAGIEPMAAGRLGEFGRSKDPHMEWLDADRVEPPLVLRTRLPGDRFRPLGAPGSRKLSDFFIDRKVPCSHRRRVPLLCDRKGLVWVVGYRIDQRVRVTDQTKRVLRVTVEPLTAPSAPAG